MNHYHRSLCKNSTRTEHTGYNFWLEQNQQIEAYIGNGTKETKMLSTQGGEKKFPTSLHRNSEFLQESVPQGILTQGKEEILLNFIAKAHRNFGITRLE